MKKKPTRIWTNLDDRAQKYYERRLREFPDNQDIVRAKGFIKAAWIDAYRAGLKARRSS